MPNCPGLWTQRITPTGSCRGSAALKATGSIADETTASRPETGKTNTPFDEDVFIGEVREALVEQGLETWVGWPVAGLNVDLVIQKNDRYLALDLIGCPGPSSDALSLDRYRMLARAGLELVPLSYSRWRRDRERCLKALGERLEASRQEGAVVVPM